MSNQEFKARVYVTLRNGVLDPAGNATKQALHTMGYDEVLDLQIGKYIELRFVATSREVAEQRIVEMCEKILSNPVIETTRFELEEAQQ